MVFFKGSFQKEDFDDMTLDDLIHWRDVATTVAKDIEREIERKTKK